MKLFDTHFIQFDQVLAISGNKFLSTSYCPVCTKSKITTVPGLFFGHSIQNENKHQIMNVHTKCNCLIPICLVRSSISCFRDLNVSYKWLIRTTGKITIAPRLIFEYSLQNENKHQIMNVHTKWNCLIPILSGLVKYWLFQGWKH